MTASVLAPVDPSGLYVVRAVCRPGPPSLDVRGLPPARARLLADRVRIALVNAGYRPPPGRVAAAVSDPDGSGTQDIVVPGLDLALALAILLSDPVHARLRRPNLVAWGRLRLDGSLASCPAPGISDLPPGPWTGRFWQPADHVPDPDEDAVLSIADTDHLAEAWDALTRFVEREHDFDPAPGRALPRT